ncbi:MAG: hypothetical protein D6791_11135 [Chloroflexi bacterium]|nr:MAG: hypothetical protein D6791_11135 [Chloroflexota bacterium]
MQHGILDRPISYRPIEELQQHVAGIERSIAGCTWFRPVKLALALMDQSDLDPAQRELLGRLREAFEAGGHVIQPEPTRDSDLILAFHIVPPGDGSLWDRIQEVDPPVAVAVRDRYDLDGLHPNLVVVVSVTEDLRSLPHVEVEDLARMAMARIGAFKMLFIKVDPASWTPEYFVLSTIEGGHPAISRSDPRCYEELRDRLVTHACANEAGGYTPVKNAISYEAWKDCRTVDYIVRAGRRLGEMGHLDAPWDAQRVVSPGRTRLIQFLLGWQRQAAGAIIAFAPDLDVPEAYRSGPFTGIPIVTCTGRHDVDKRHLRRDEDLVAVSLRDGTLYAFGVEGRRLKGPSIEGDELVGGMMASPVVRLREHPDGYVFDPDGNIAVPRIWAIVHTHRGVEEIRPIRVNGQAVHVVEHIRPNVEQFPYAVGCGKDMMFEISRDGMARSTAATDFESPAVVGMFDVANHGTNFFLYCAPRPGTNIIPRDPFENFLNLLDPDVYGAIKLTTEVPQI